MFIIYVTNSNIFCDKVKAILLIAKFCMHHILFNIATPFIIKIHRHIYLRVQSNRDLGRLQPKRPGVHRSLLVPRLFRYSEFAFRGVRLTN